MDANLPMTKLAKVMRFIDKWPQRRLIGNFGGILHEGPEVENPAWRRVQRRLEIEVSLF